MGDDWRLFAAIELTDEIQRRVERAAGYLEGSGLRARWVAPESSHVTLKFLGATAQEVVPGIRRALREATAPAAPFELMTARLGAFPSPRRPRVLWLGLAGDLDRLQALHAAIEAALERAGVERERRPFHGHITVGRIREHDRPAVGEVERVLAGGPIAPALRLPVAEVTLFRSELRRSGPIYTVVERFALGG